MSIVVNFIGGPAAGKSTMAALLFCELRIQGYNCEMVSEYPKDVVWESNFSRIKYQPIIFANQAYRQKLLWNKTDIMISDSPLVLSLVYNRDSTSETFKKLVLEEFNSYMNLNYFVNRDDYRFEQSGRIHDPLESQVLDTMIREAISSNHIKFKTIPSRKETLPMIVNDIQTAFDGINSI